MIKEDDFYANLAGEDGESDEAKRSWFKRIKKGILTPTKDKADAPEGLWTKCPNCKYTCTVSELRENLFVCPSCSHHHRIGSGEYFDILFDDNEYKELFANIVSTDFLGFVDLKPYNKRLEETHAKTDIHDSITVAHGKLKGNEFVIACMDFEFIGGSLGSVMGEKISRACDYCMLHKIPFMIINKSGGARMMESAQPVPIIPSPLASTPREGPGRGCAGSSLHRAIQSPWPRAAPANREHRAGDGGW